MVRRKGKLGFRLLGPPVSVNFFGSRPRVRSSISTLLVNFTWLGLGLGLGFRVWVRVRVRVGV